MSAEYKIAKKCGNIYAGHLFPGQSVFVDRIVVNGTTGRRKAQVWSPLTLTIDVPVGCIEGLAEAVASGAVPVWSWTPGSVDMVEVTA